ncbi:MAG: ABC transporter ATP-binding protein [Acidobacteriota bacterium]
MSRLEAASWPEERLGEAMAALARAAGLLDSDGERDGSGRVEASSGETAPSGGVDGAWIQAVANRLGLEAESSSVDYVGVEGSLRRLGPCILPLPSAGADGGAAAEDPSEPRRWLVMVSCRRELVLLGPDLSHRRFAARRLAERLREPLEAPARGRLEELLAAADVPTASRARPLQALLDRNLAGVPVCQAWSLHLPPEAAPGRQLRDAGLLRPVSTLVVAHAAEYALFAGSWWLLGRGALSGRFDSGWLWAWALLLLTIVPIRAGGFWSQRIFTLGAGALLKRRLLAGALRSDPEDIKVRGAGRFLGRVFESESVETLALNGGFLALLSALELGLAAWVLSLGGAGSWHLGLLAGWLLLAALLGWRYVRVRQRWTRNRVGMTHRLVERLVGQRTRLVQEPRENWHEAEDRDLRDYLASSRSLDRWVPRVAVVVGRGWLLLSLAALAPATASGASSTLLAVSLGGILLAYRALEKLTAGFFAVAGAAIAWRQVRPLFEAAERGPLPGSPSLLREAEAAPEASRLVEARRLSYRYPRRSRPTLEGWSLELKRGDRVLLEGASGSGKSTLIALLAGIREPRSGHLLLRGIDRRGWGSLGWRRWVVAAPQFHENHIFVGSLAYNLLLGRRWPATQQDLVEADHVCQRLGLGELVARMPGGLMQPVGESGWRLSHGERSRVCLARALLQGADLVILDESFAALDPETLHQALECARDIAPTLFVVAHV